MRNFSIKKLLDILQHWLYSELYSAYLDDPGFIISPAESNNFLLVELIVALPAEALLCSLFTSLFESFLSEVVRSFSRALSLSSSDRIYGWNRALIN